MTTRLHSTPAAVAAIMRGIGQRRPRRSIGKAFICVPCAVAWSGDEADCWNCGLPASSEYARHRKAVDTLLASLGTARRTPPATRRSRLDAAIGSALLQVETVVTVDGTSLARRRKELLAWMGAGAR